MAEPCRVSRAQYPPQASRRGTDPANRLPVNFASPLQSWRPLPISMHKGVRAERRDDDPGTTKSARTRGSADAGGG